MKPQSYLELVEEYQPLVKRLAVSFSKKRYEAEIEDWVSEILLKAWEKIHLFRGDADFKFWLIRIATNHMRDRIRRKSLVTFVSMNGAYKTGESHIHGKLRDEDFDFEDKDPLPNEVLELTELQARVRSAVLGLRPHHRQLIIDHYFNDKSFEEINLETGIPIGTIKSRVFRARVALSAPLKGIVEVPKPFDREGKRVGG